MNKSDLVDAMVQRGWSKKQATAAIEVIFDIIIREIAAGGKVIITGFGTFERIVRAPRKGRNMRTGESVKVNGAVVPSFRAGTAFKMFVAAPWTLPKGVMAAVRAAPAQAAKKTR